ncbi:hypothetical protein D3C87_1941850 [compost metagenome]
MLAYGGINLDQAAFLQLLDVHSDGSVAEIQLLGNFIEIEGLIGGEQLQNLNPDLRAECFEDINPAH